MIQMSLVDTWAATGAGAFTLSRKRPVYAGWLACVSQPAGAGGRAERVAVVRSDERVGDEPSRRLGVAALLDRGVVRPGRSARARRPRACRDAHGLQRALRGGRPAAARQRRGRSRLRYRARAMAHGCSARLLERIGRSAHLAELETATADPLFDYSAPTDRRPYYFNMLRPRALFALDQLSRSGALGGNLQATLLLLALMAICTALRHRHHRLASRGDRTPADAVDGVRGVDGLLRGHRVRLHARPDRAAAAFLGVHRSPDVHAGDRALLDAALHGRGKFPVGHGVSRARQPRIRGCRSASPSPCRSPPRFCRSRSPPASRPASPSARSWSWRSPARWPSSSACAFRLACG